jgi:hypothetical protein
MDEIVDSFTFYVSNPDRAQDLLRQTGAFKTALAGLEKKDFDAIGFGVFEIDAMAISAACEQLDLEVPHEDYRKEYEAARDALVSLGAGAN